VSKPKTMNLYLEGEDGRKHLGIWIPARDAGRYYTALESGWENLQGELMEILEPFESYEEPEEEQPKPIPDGAMTPPGYDYEKGTA